MKKFFIEAIQKLPTLYVCDGTEVLSLPDETAVAMTLYHPPIIYENGQWRPVVAKFPEQTFEFPKINTNENPL